MYDESELSKQIIERVAKVIQPRTHARNYYLLDRDTLSELPTKELMHFLLGADLHSGSTWARKLMGQWDVQVCADHEVPTHSREPWRSYLRKGLMVYRLSHRHVRRRARNSGGGK